eukprot:IDg22838t1
MVGSPSEGRCITASPLGGGVVRASSESARQWRKPLGWRRELMLEQAGPQGRMLTQNVTDACRIGLRGRQQEVVPNGLGFGTRLGIRRWAARCSSVRGGVRIGVRSVRSAL